jgi:hypothetical protein
VLLEVEVVALDGAVDGRAAQQVDALLAEHDPLAVHVGVLVLQEDAVGAGAARMLSVVSLLWGIG